jgi:RNA polymerase sigma-70 factor (ECF subfamily)
MATDLMPLADGQTDDEAFESEALPCFDDVYRFALSLTRKVADAEDVVQETYLRAYRSWHTFQRGSDARRWLFTICHHAFNRTHERGRHQVELADGDIDHGHVARDEHLLARIDLAPALSHALDCLHEPYRSVVILVLVQDQSYEAAAAILGVPMGTVRSRLSRGRRLLQDMLATYGCDAGLRHRVMVGARGPRERD